MRSAVAALLVIAAACGNDASAPTADLAVDVRDMAVADLAPSPCPPTFSFPGGGPCSGNAVCRYPTDAGPYDHLSCNGVHWQAGNCPFGPGYTTQFNGCVGPCQEYWGEAYTFCQCLANGVGVCCIDTGGIPTCGNFDGGS